MPIIILASCPFQPEIEIKTVNVKCYSSTFLHTIKRKKPLVSGSIPYKKVGRCFIYIAKIQKIIYWDNENINYLYRFYMFFISAINN